MEGFSIDPLTSVGSSLSWGTVFLACQNIDTPRLEVELLLAHAMQCLPLDLYVNPRQSLSCEQASSFYHLLKKRAEYCPIAYLIGKKGFMSLDFRVDSSVLIPRPETEHLVEESLALAQEQSWRVLDLGTGSGNIVVSLARYAPQLSLVAIDISFAALEIARQNSLMHEVADRISFLQGDLFSPLLAKSQFDLMVSNPPYISQGEYSSLMPEVKNYEPPNALLGGEDGLQFYRRIFSQSVHYLRKGGYLMVEIGYGQRDAVVNLLSHGLVCEKILPDYAGIDRVVIAKKVA